MISSFDHNRKDTSQKIKQEFNGELWYRELLIQIKLQVIQDQNQLIYITDDGVILRTEDIKGFPNSIEILKNLEQIKHLSWLGEYGKKQDKIGKWKVAWKGQTIQDAGGEYSEEGKKQGHWKDLIKNYWSKARVYETGKYQNDERRGYWNYVYEDREIEGGFYNEQGYKNGKWVDLSQKFWDWSQVTYHGDYQNDQRIGSWDIKHRGDLIGGGQYDMQGKKNGKWTELSDKFYLYGQVIQKGEYKNGQKIDKLIGGGAYDQQGLKSGEWIEMSDDYYGWSQVTYQGVYKNGKKVGKWVINFRDSSESKFECIGGGSFDEKGLQSGIWIELSPSFDCDNQVTYTGEYRFGKKQGRWDIYYKKHYGSRSRDLIGGGSFDQYGLKIGKWIDLSNKFYSLSQLTFNGEYLNGNKIGSWEVNYRMQGRNEFEKIHSGLYDDQSLKNGYWTEESDIFNDDNQVVYKGEYKNGKRIGKWDIIFDGEQIGGGLFDELSLKTGKWIELSDDFRISSQTIYQGDYIQGQKIGKWIRMWRDEEERSEGFQFCEEIQCD